VLKHPGHGVGPRSVDQAGQFIHGRVGGFRIGSTEGDAGQHDAFPERPVNEAGGLAAKLAEGATVGIIAPVIWNTVGFQRFHWF
jgi:hypothetical protein